MIILTGGSSGIGENIKEYLRNKGEKVITLSRREISNDKDHMSCDITDYKSLKDVYKKISKSKNKVSSIINCAGIASMNLALTTPPQITEKIIRTNLIGTIFTNQIFSPLLIKNRSGRIINFSTIAVSLSLKGESVYVASKAGVESFSRVLAKELSHFNITVNCIAPGPIRTNLLSGITENQISNITKNQIIQKEMKTSDILNLITILLSDNSKNITGQVLHLGGV